MGCCMSSAVYITPPHELAVNKLDQHLQRKQGLKTAEQLSKQNGKYAEDPTEWRKRKEKDFSPTKDVGVWQHTRETLSKAHSMSQFANRLNLSQHKMLDALTQFQSLDKDGNGVIDKAEFAQIFKLDPEDRKTTYMFNALDVDRNGQLNYKVRMRWMARGRNTYQYIPVRTQLAKHIPDANGAHTSPQEFLIMAAHFNGDIDDMTRARFCFKMVDANNDGVVTFTELKTFLLDTMFADSSAKQRHVGRINEIITTKLGMKSYETLKEQDFAEMVVANKAVFTPMLAVYSKLHKIFDHTFDRSGVKHNREELHKYFQREDANPEGMGVIPGHGARYSAAATQIGAQHNSNSAKKMDFQHEFSGTKRKERVLAPWEDGQHDGSELYQSPSKRDHGAGAPATNNGEDSESEDEPPKLQRKISQDDSLHNYMGARRGHRGPGVQRGMGIQYARRPVRNGDNIDYGIASGIDIDVLKRVGGGMGRARVDEIDDEPVMTPRRRSMEETDFVKAVTARHSQSGTSRNGVPATLTFE